MSTHRQIPMEKSAGRFFHNHRFLPRGDPKGSLRFFYWLHIGYDQSTMMLKSFLTAVLVANAVFGSLCTMPIQMAEAESVPVHHQEINMSPLDAMSHLDCENCLQQKKVNIVAAAQCSGHCFVDVFRTTDISNNSADYSVRGTVPLAYTVVDVVNKNESRDTDSYSQLPKDISIHTIILRS